MRLTLEGGVGGGGEGMTQIGRPTQTHTPKWENGILGCDGMSHTAAKPPRLKLYTVISIIDQTASPTQLHQSQQIHTFFSSDAAIK